MIELTLMKTPDKASELENQNLETEGERIPSKVGERDFVIVLALKEKHSPQRNLVSN